MHFLKNGNYNKKLYYTQNVSLKELFLIEFTHDKVLLLEKNI